MCEPCGMSSKEIAVELIGKLPDESTLMDIAHEIEFVAGLRRGAEELDRGERVTAEELRKSVATWANLSK